MWRDPLDELIEDLETRGAGRASFRWSVLQRVLEDLQYVISSTLYPRHPHPDHDQRITRLNNWRRARTEPEAARTASLERAQCRGRGECLT
jgi:hypothetical protein